MIPKTKLAYNIWQGNNSSTTFDFDFIIDKPTDLIAVIWDMTADTREVLEYETDYTIAEFSNVNGSSITYPIADDAEKLQENEKIILLSARDVQQGWDFYSSEKFNPQRYEDAIDYIVTIQKQFERDINRALKIPLGLDTTPEEYLENIETKIENLEKDVTAIKSEIKIINGKIVKIDSRLTVAEGKIVAMDGRLTVVEEKTEALGNKLNALSNKQNEIEQRVIKNEKDISDLKAGGGGQSPTGGGTMYVCYAVNKAKCQEGSSLVDYVANKQAIDNGELPSTISYAVGGENPNLVVTTAKGKTITISSIPDLDVSTVAALEGGGVGVWTRCVDSDGLFKLVHHSNFVYSNANADFRTQYTLENFPNGIIVQYTGVDPFETWELDGEGNWSEFNAVPLETFEIVEKEDGSYGVSVLFFQLPNIGVNSFNFNQNAAVYGILTMYNLPLVEINTNTTLSSILTQQTNNTFKLDCRKNLGDNYAVEDFPYGLKEKLNIELELNSSELEDIYVSANTDALSCYTENGVSVYFQNIGKTTNGKLYTSFEIPMLEPVMYLKFEKLGVAGDVSIDKFKIEVLGYQETRIEGGGVKNNGSEEPDTPDNPSDTTVFKFIPYKTAGGVEFKVHQPVQIDWGDGTTEDYTTITNTTTVAHTYSDVTTDYTVTITPSGVDYIIAENKGSGSYALATTGLTGLSVKEYLNPLPLLKIKESDGELTNVADFTIFHGTSFPENFMMNNSTITGLIVEKSIISGENYTETGNIPSNAFSALALKHIICKDYRYFIKYDENIDWTFLENLISTNALVLEYLQAPFSTLTKTGAMSLMSELQCLITNGATAGMCDNMSNLEYVQFDYLTEIPENLFGISCSGIKGVAFRSGTYSTIPSTLFTNCTGLKHFDFMDNAVVTSFYSSTDNCSLLGQPVSFSGITHATSLGLSPYAPVNKPVNNFKGVDYSLAGMSALTNLPSGWFMNHQYITSAVGFCQDCSSLTSIPSNLFNKSVLEWATCCFQNCTSLTTVPSGLFASSSNLKGISACFQGCTSLTTIQNGAFNYCSSLYLAEQCFKDCSNLVTVPTFLFRWDGRGTRSDVGKKSIDFTSAFQGCSKIIAPADLFYNNLDGNFKCVFKNAATAEGSSISASVFGDSKSTRFLLNCDLEAAFEGAGNDSAALPDLWNYTFVSGDVNFLCSNKAGTYTNAKGTNVSEIPDEWK